MEATWLNVRTQGRRYQLNADHLSFMMEPEMLEVELTRTNDVRAAYVPHGAWGLLRRCSVKPIYVK
jgi:hypothetical protein